MALPIKTSPDDVSAVVSFLKSRVSGASVSEAKAVVSATLLDGRKIAAYESWGFITRDGDQLRLTETGRDLSRADDNGRTQLFGASIRAIAPYMLVLEWIYHQDINEVTSIEVAAHWHAHCPQHLGTESDRTITDQAVCFFSLAQAAGLGTRIVGRKGQPTRLEVNHAALHQFLEEETTDRVLVPASTVATGTEIGSNGDASDHLAQEGSASSSVIHSQAAPSKSVQQRVFITHGSNQEVVRQLKELLTFGKFTPVVAEEHETPSKPVPDKVLEDMRTCSAAVIHVESEQDLLDSEGGVVRKLNDNVLIEIGAAMALYGRNFILLVQDGVHLPSNLQGLYRCDYQGEKLDYDATMKLLKAFNEFS